MKKNYFYHPLIKVLCLLLCMASLMAFAFCGLRAIMLEAWGVMRAEPVFSIPYHNSIRYQDSICLWWPAGWQWSTVLAADENDYWFGKDPLCDSVRMMLQSPLFSDYMDHTAVNTVSADAAFPEIVVDDSRVVYPAGYENELQAFLRKYPAEASNLRFRVLLDERVIVTNDADWREELIHEGTYTAIAVDGDGAAVHTLRLEWGLLHDMRCEDDYRTYFRAWENDVVRWEKWLLATGVTALVSLVLLFAVLFQTGMRYSAPGVHLNRIDRLPAEPVLFVKAMLCLLAVAGIFAMEWYLESGLLLLFGYLDGNLLDWLVPLGAGALFVIAVYLGLSVLRGAVRRVRAGKWWQNTVIFKILRPLGCGLRLLRDSTRTVLSNLPLTAKWLAGCAIFGMWTLLAMFAQGLEIIWFLTALAAGLFLCVYMLEFDVIRRLAKKIAAGDINAHTDTSRLHGAPKQIGDSLNHIGDAISVAVEDRMKSERFRTELITNVSHDLKTPLTSIINYTDLLSKEELENETAKEYVDVLFRQAVRLKKLTEDLLEASKASTGAISVSLQPTDAVELLTQAVGEYEERFAACSLHAVLDIKHSPLWISADGKHLWRVFDNLLSNICKYSMSGTRVYLTAEAVGKTVVITFRNIAENQIAVSAEELTERFVRGDASRHTEGSGLGLAIADSLVKLQGGTLSLTVDGDLFKAVIRLDAVPAPQDAALTATPDTP